MSETRTFTNSDLRTAVSVALKRDRARIGAILAAPEAAGRESLARTLATTTDMSVEQVKAALAAAPAADAAALPPTSSVTAASADDTAALWDQALSARGFPMQKANTATDSSALWDASLKSRGMQVG
ncbi:hypothetical protein [Bradyrhizobium sp. CCBAU 45384]|uniref:hypothetical protein n=1 Tax=Bradyrhizobium sp. CCBAU 45384 TaxID=858428 RepID=UPI002305EC41|nr:hypothetical protein [Bradyrhizobium sp. CCBAU 45384]MDA9407941.1 hypothetical protein [Bradyrhizobium sp. CCBAU 45384]